MTPSQAIGFQESEFFIGSGFANLYLQHILDCLDDLLFAMHVTGDGFAYTDHVFAKGLSRQKGIKRCCSIYLCG
jgi:hypothetical protein